MRNNSTAATDMVNHEVKARMQGNEHFDSLPKNNRAQILRFPAVEFELFDFVVFKERMEYINGEWTGYSSRPFPLQVLGFHNEEGMHATKGKPDPPANNPESTNPTYVPQQPPAFRPLCKILDQPLPNVELNTRDLTRWRMALRAMQGFLRSNADDDIAVERLRQQLRYSKLIVYRCGDWADISDIFEEKRVALPFCVAGIIYGGLHALAWFARFNSWVEQLLWRISACMVMGGLFIILSLEKVNNSSYLVDTWEILIYPVLLAYMLARAYLVVESFINLSHLPAGVYDVPRWTVYFPHV
ncbi:MAG: hypothetical protein Q9181_007860 [Wetmoreana brouardii]